MAIESTYPKLVEICKRFFELDRVNQLVVTGDCGTTVLTVPLLRAHPHNPPACLSFCLPVDLTVCLSVCLSVSLYVCQQETMGILMGKAQLSGKMTLAQAGKCREQLLGTNVVNIRLCTWRHHRSMLPCHTDCSMLPCHKEKQTVWKLSFGSDPPATLTMMVPTTGQRMSVSVSWILKALLISIRYPSSHKSAHQSKHTPIQPFWLTKGKLYQIYFMLK